MLKAMLYKELRETIGIALLGLLAYAYLVANSIGWDTPMMYAGTSRVPFVADQFVGNFTFIAALLCLALGLRQSLGESFRDTWLFLFHRPMDRRKILAVKLATGLGLYLLCSVAPILAFGRWAASPGKHAGPFFWEMTVPAWQTWVSMSGLYLGAFLTGIRPGRWIGTRLLPALAVGVLLALVNMIPAWWTVGLGALVVLETCLVLSILFVADARDF